MENVNAQHICATSACAWNPMKRLVWTEPIVFPDERDSMPALIPAPLHKTRLNMHVQSTGFLKYVYTYFFFAPAAFIDGLASPTPSCRRRLVDGGFIRHVLLAWAAITAGAGPQTHRQNLITFRLSMVCRRNGLNLVWERDLEEHLWGCAGLKAVEKVEFSI